MFHKIQMKLSFICCSITAVIVLFIILCCLHVSEHNMYGQERALFLLKAGTISSDLHFSESIDLHWYQRHHMGKNILSIEVNGSPSTLSALLLSEQEQAILQELTEYAKREHPADDSTALSPNTRQQTFTYTNNRHEFLVMKAVLIEKEQEISYTYLYNLDNFYRNINGQRIRFLVIWLLSIAILYLFSHTFTSHVLKPLAKNDENQRHFVAVASHELRSPLAVFKTGLSILKHKPDPGKTTHIFTLMENEMSRMERLIEDLLCLSKMENAEYPFHFEHTDLAVLLTAAYDKYAALAASRNLTLSLSIAAGYDYNCLCDSQRIEQAVIILLDNALSYTPGGQSVTLKLYGSHKKCYLQVIDSGKGIPASEKEKIFDRFYQVNSSHSHKEHFGLGLSIAREICHRHGGKISVSDTHGGGSTFTLILPKTNSHT